MTNAYVVVGAAGLSALLFLPPATASAGAGSLLGKVRPTRLVHKKLELGFGNVLLSARIAYIDRFDTLNLDVHKVSGPFEVRCRFERSNKHKFELQVREFKSKLGNWWVTGKKAHHHLAGDAVLVFQVVPDATPASFRYEIANISPKGPAANWVYFHDCEVRAL